MQRWLCGLIALMILLILPGCGNDGAGEIVRYDLSSTVKNLDPQFTTDEAARMIIGNTFEGLLRQNPDGTLGPSAATGYHVSDDGLTYTFSLRTDAYWLDPRKPDENEPVTAHDFVFAFHRMFDRAVPSPFAASYLSLQNAQAVLRGSLPPAKLGVRAVDDYTLEFLLDRPDSRLPELLSSSAAMPCNEAFFHSTRARYGMDLKSMQFNGAFYVRNWEVQKGLISLRRNKNYHAQDRVIAGGVDLYLPAAQETDPQSRFFAEETDACRVGYNTAQALKEEGAQVVSFEDTVWVLAMNLSHPRLQNTDLRRAISYAVDRASLQTRLPKNLRGGAVFIPPAIGSAGNCFRDYAGEGTAAAYSPELSRRSYLAAMEELEDQLPAIREILVCDEDPQPFLAGFIQKDLQALSISTGLVRLPREELMRRVKSGDYALAILPLTAEDSSPAAFLDSFRSDAGNNITRYQSAVYDRLLDAAAAAAGDAQYELFRQAEQQLLSDSPIVPLYFETTSYAMNKGVSGIRFSPFLSGIDFTQARKK